MIKKARNKAVKKTKKKKAAKPRAPEPKPEPEAAIIAAPIPVPVPGPQRVVCPGCRRSIWDYDLFTCRHCKKGGCTRCGYPPAELIECPHCGGRVEKKGAS
jgi:hypothetical protein